VGADAFIRHKETGEHEDSIDNMFICKGPTMYHPTLNITLIALAASSCITLGGEVIPSGQYPDSIASHRELDMQDLARSMIRSLPQDQQMMIAQQGGPGSDAVDLSGFASNFDHHDQASTPAQIPHGTSAKDYFNMLASDDLRAVLTDQQLSVAQRIAELMDEGKEMPAMCFAPETNPKYAWLINELLDYQFVSDDGSRFQQGSRWSRTAVSGNGLQQGQPTTITYSFAPDGSFVPDSGLGSGNSTLFQWLNGLYGNPANWQTLFQSVFSRWAQLTGTSYIFEPNDDGAPMSSQRGVLGVRGDVRIFAFNYPADGDFGVLAYNFFPNNGDMAIDAFDAFYNNTDGSSLRFRNVVAHEHGHGLGMAHVCPAIQTKLMEPFISTAYDGPQLDDILNGIRHYGDIAEPNDTIAQATDLGSLAIGGSLSMSNLGIDDDADDDIFHISVDQRTFITLTTSPDADVYAQGQQTTQCNGGTLTDYNSIQDLQITAMDSSGNVLATANDSGIGDPETMLFLAPAAGDYFFMIDGASIVNNVQRYLLDATGSDAPFLEPIIQAVVPPSIDPGVINPLSVTIDPQEDIIVPGSEQLLFSIDGAPFSSIPLTSDGGNNYTAPLPPVSCDETIHFYFSVEGQTAGQVIFPEDGPNMPFNPAIGDLFITFLDDFETDQGWTVSGSVSGVFSGEWERGVPAGLGNRGDPTEDADGSGSAYLTGNAVGNTDVDGGQTILTSPIFTLAINPEARIFYSRWFDNTGGGTGSAPGEDVFTVQISNNNGASWTTLETVGPSTPESSGGWFDAQFRVADFVTPTDLVRIRFIAEDIGENSVIEAAVDAIDVRGRTCQDPDPICTADFTGDGILDFFDVSAFISAFGSHDPAADITNDGIFDFFDVSAFISAFAAGCP